MGRKKKEIIKDVEIVKEDNIEEVKIDEQDLTSNISKEEVLDAVNNVSKEAKKEIRKEKSRNFFKELGAFLVIVLIIGGIGFGTYYWYKNYYQPNKNVVKEDQIDESTKMKMVSIDVTDDIVVLDDKYVILSDDSIVNKVLDIKGNVLFEGEIEGTDYYLDKTDNLYVVSYEDGDYSNKAVVNKLVSDKFEEVITLSRDNIYYNAVLYNNKLIGFVGFNANSDNYFDEAENNDVYYALGDNEVEVGEYHFVGDTNVDYLYDDIVTASDKYVVVSKKIDSKLKYGLYDISNKEIIIDATYDNLIAVGKDEFIAVKDNKVGIINSKSEKLVDFEYDFIAPFEKHFVVSKNNKMAIMDAEHNLITGFVFDFDDYNGKLKYEYRLCCSEFNTIYSYKIGDKYVLNNHYMANRYRYESDDIYVIDSKGDYEVIEASDFVSFDGMVYSYYDGVFKFYNEDLTLKYEIDMNKFDNYKPSINDSGVLELINDNTISFANKYYFNYEDGSLVDGLQEWSYKVGNATLEFDVEKYGYKLTIGDKTIKIDSVDVHVLEDGTFYLYTLDNFFSVQRSE